jgi:UDP-2-acetamido-2,6-beta-L-arabino-hexul-4-ose reductase
MVKMCRPRNKLSLPRKILVTGANGFMGKNLVARLKELPNIKVTSFTRDCSLSDLSGLVANAEFIFHLAGVNRPTDANEFNSINIDLTGIICDAISNSGRNIPLVFASSAQAELNNPYGHSKLAAESILESLARDSGNTVHIYRLPGVFGKWARPNYNSVVATFCHNITRDLPVRIDDPDVVMRLVYVDDVINEFLMALDDVRVGLHRGEIKKVYSISVSELAHKIHTFKKSRTSLLVEHVGVGLVRALYSTYISYLPPEQFFYDLPQHNDDRGVFVEMLKTPDCGQFSFFTVYPGITRGSHYHHTKTEKFLIVKGSALMKFRNLVTGEISTITISADRPQVVDTIPGWVHDITNIGDEEAIIMLWANEVFDRDHPDCIPCKV